ncbi:RNA polymerase sigma factor [Comamonas sp. Tr-654]|uniref:RNA polymerase sigma factor n=1 Tax=Comamonas sp. Tr-654 TaxID=2608341 RepID=UPI00141EF554|nr:RNA polymerase sigma factor [Comamonas sp. Tr-654]NIF86070.1 RNA polymerase sigma factor [Comamonas sp. Tr-654]
MSDEVVPGLLDYLNKSYSNLKRRLTQVLGNADLASDALHDTWVRVKDRGDQRPIEQPAAYLMRIAINIAADIQRRQRRCLSGEEVDALLDEMIDPAPCPARVAEARSDIAALSQIMSRMPERRRVIMALVHWENVTQKEVAGRLGISLRTVEYELRRAHDELNAQMDGHARK